MIRNCFNRTIFNGILNQLPRSIYAGSILGDLRAHRHYTLFSDQIQQWHKELSQQLDDRENRIKNLTAHLIRAATPRSDFDVRRMEETIKQLADIALDLEKKVVDSMKSLLSTGTGEMEQRNIYFAEKHFDQLIHQSADIVKTQSQVVSLISEAYYYKALIMIVRSGERINGSQEKQKLALQNYEDKAIEFLKLATQNNPENQDAIKLLNILQKPTSFGAITAKTLIHSQYSPNVTYY